MNLPANGLTTPKSAQAVHFGRPRNRTREERKAAEAAMAPAATALAERPEGSSIEPAVDTVVLKTPHRTVRKKPTQKAATPEAEPAKTAPVIRGFQHIPHLAQMGAVVAQIRKPSDFERMVKHADGLPVEADATLFRVGDSELLTLPISDAHNDPEVIYSDDLTRQKFTRPALPGRTVPGYYESGPNGVSVQLPDTGASVELYVHPNEEYYGAAYKNHVFHRPDPYGPAIELTGQNRFEGLAIFYRLGRMGLLPNNYYLRQEFNEAYAIRENILDDPDIRAKWQDQRSKAGRAQSR